MQTTNVVYGGAHPNQLVSAGDGPTLLFNNDEINPLILCNDIGLNVLNQDGNSILEPLGSLVVMGTKDIYASPLTPGITIEVFIIPDGIYYSASPAQIAAQINALGLATATNQGTQIGYENSTAGNTSNINIGISQGTNPALYSLNGQAPSLHSHYPNPNFCNAGGAADISGWSGSGGTIATAGNFGSIALPGGSGESTGAYCTAPGTNNFLGVFPASGIPCQPGQIPYLHYKMYSANLVGAPGAYFGQCAFQFYSNAGFISSINVNVIVTSNNAWQKFYAKCPSPGAPAGTTYCVAAPALVIGAGNIPNNVTAYFTSINAGILGQPGTHSGDRAAHNAIAGVPLQNLHNLLYSTATTLAASTSITFPNILFSQPGWEVFISLGMPAATTKPFVRIQFAWQDAVSGNNVWYDEWYLAAGSILLNSNSFMGRGPALGNQLSITIGNADPAQILTYSVSVYQTSQISATSRADIRSNTIIGFTVPGFSIPDISDPNALVLASRKAAGVAAGATDVTILPLFAGKINLYAVTSGVNDMTLSIINVGNNSLTATTTALYQAAGAGIINPTGLQGGQIYLPRSHCSMNLKNGNAAAQQLQYQVIMSEY